MAEIKIKIPDELEFIKRMPNVDWSLLLNRIIREEMEKVARLKKITSKSKISEADVEELTEKINKSLSKRY